MVKLETTLILVAVVGDKRSLVSYFTANLMYAHLVKFDANSSLALGLSLGVANNSLNQDMVNTKDLNDPAKFDGRIFFLVGWQIPINGILILMHGFSDLKNHVDINFSRLNSLDVCLFNISGFVFMLIGWVEK
ncbi:MAG: type IX secretion system membrane protein PorP/SprF [Bacteroidia bacterium]|nr:type IX secretion system membrane protein PorP/SprF [Bacteroidia bacterium]MCF8427884.1 type IX secretion system membrane protein PorP/SprF [Bacteroidia bacterium]MCF8448155.1 type IX secretion system membrane protein PorP/SprF [Bacteroidia bacterium]